MNSNTLPLRDHFHDVRQFSAQYMHNQGSEADRQRLNHKIWELEQHREHVSNAAEVLPCYAAELKLIKRRAATKFAA